MAKWEIPKRRWGNHITFMRTHATFCGFRQNKVKEIADFGKIRLKHFADFGKSCIFARIIN